MDIDTCHKMVQEVCRSVEWTNLISGRNSLETAFVILTIH